MVHEKSPERKETTLSCNTLENDGYGKSKHPRSGTQNMFNNLRVKSIAGETGV